MKKKGYSEWMKRDRLLYSYRREKERERVQARERKDGERWEIGM